MNNSPEQTDPRGPFITTISGAKFYINECNVEDIPIQDIAHSLSFNCRFNGHISRFYSVAEHSIRVADQIIDPRSELWALLHDVSEAFVPDIPRPFKSVMQGFDAFEELVLEKVADQHMLSWPPPEDVAIVDRNIVAVEAAILFPEPPEWVQAYDTENIYLPQTIGWSPDRAYEEFMLRYVQVTDRGI